LDLAFDGSAVFGGSRSKRYVLELEDGKVKAMHVEPDNTGLDGKCIAFQWLPWMKRSNILQCLRLRRSLVKEWRGGVGKRGTRLTRGTL
jgi:uncharacterized heparinase superfamily protein